MPTLKQQFESGQAAQPKVRKYVVKPQDDPISVAAATGVSPTALLGANGIKSLTPGQTLNIPQTTASQTAAVGGSLMGIPLTPGPSAVTNNLVTGGPGAPGGVMGTGNASQMSLSRGAFTVGNQSTLFSAPAPQVPQVNPRQSNLISPVSAPIVPPVPGVNNPQAQPGGYGYTAQQIAGRPNTQMPQSSVPYSILASANPAALAGLNPVSGTSGAGGVSAGPWNNDGQYDARDVNWKRGTAGYGQDFTRGRNRDLRHIRIGQNQESPSVMDAAPSIISANPYLNNVLTWRAST